MKREKFDYIMNQLCPNDLSDSWDNPGYQIDFGKKEYDRVLVALEVTSQIIEEAKSYNVDLILTHHPLIFNPFKKLIICNYPDKLIFDLMETGISVYSTHTNFDKLHGGNNDYIGEILGLDNVRPFKEDNGYCRVGETSFTINFYELIKKVSESLGVDERYFKITGSVDKQIRKVGWCTGSGAEFIDEAIKEGCDLFITGDLKYHDAQKAKELGICVLDAGHFGTEKIYVENMTQKLINAFEYEIIDIIDSQKDINPYGLF